MIPLVNYVHVPVHVHEISFAQKASENERLFPPFTFFPLRRWICHPGFVNGNVKVNVNVINGGEAPRLLGQGL